MSVESELKALADSIRVKSGKTEKLSISAMKTAVDGIENGTDVSGVTATAPHVLEGDIFVDADGRKVTGTMPNNGSTSQTIDGLTVKSCRIPAGYTSGGTVSLTDDIDNLADVQASLAEQILAKLEELGYITGGGSESRLPAEYQEVAYLESTGTQYIDTGFVPNQDTRVITEHFYTKDPQNRGFMYGAGVSATNRTFEMYTWGGNWNSPYGDTNITMPLLSSLSIGGKIHADKNKNNITITYSDGTERTASCPYITFTAPGNMWLFAINRGNSSVDFRADCVQLCYCKVWDGDTPVRDFVPCYRKSDNKPGMYDLVTSTFYTNAGTGEFLYG